MREVLSSKRLAPPLFRYSQVVRSGGHYYCSGMLPVDEDGALVGTGPGEQAAQILANAQILMEDLGLGWENLVMARIFTTRLDLFPEINRAWEAVFDGSVAPPARTSLGVAALPMGAQVEIEFTFHKE